VRYSQVHRTLNLTHVQQDAGYISAALRLKEQPRHSFRLPLTARGPRLFKQSAEPAIMASTAIAAIFYAILIAGLQAGLNFSSGLNAVPKRAVMMSMRLSPIHHTLWLPRWNGADKGIAKAGDAYCHFGTLPGGWIKSLEGSPFPLYSEDGGTFPTWQPYSQECQLKPLLGPYLQVAFFPAPTHTLACVSSHSSGKGTVHLACAV